MRLDRAFTLVEVVTSAVVILLLTAICTPALSAARHSAAISKSSSNLRQFFLLTKLYQMECDGDGNYGDLDIMGLPPVEFVYFHRFGTPLEMWKSPCGQNPQWADGPVVIQYEYKPGEGGPEFAYNARLFREKLLLYTDLNCGDPTVPLHDQFLKHRGLGVLLSGQLINKNTLGSPADPYWWSDPEVH